MVSRIGALSFAVLLTCLVAGCDWNWLSSTPADSGVVLAATAFAPGLGTGDQLQTRTQLQQQLQDGTGGNCLNADYTGDGTPDRLRLRDGSCQN